MMTDARTVLVTGGTGRLGAVLVAALLDCGHRVLFTARRQETMAQLCARFPAACSDGRLHGFLADLSAEAGVVDLLVAIAASDFKVEVLVNNARSLDYLRIGEDGTVSRADFMGEFLVDVVVPYELTNGLAAQGALRSVVNIGSMYGLVAANPSLYADPVRQSMPHYGVAKAALVHLTRELAVRFAPKGIRVNAVSYGGVRGRVDDAFIDRYAGLCPNGRMLEESDVAGPVLFLMGDGATGMTGHNLVVDGGWTAW